ncbi:hypothetical protein [Leptolyngbya sp. Heron Island J]|nr:hypothetical protein [Leptolyngbya sp. Heron Island J]
MGGSTPQRSRRTRPKRAFGDSVRGEVATSWAPYNQPHNHNP